MSSNEEIDPTEVDLSRLWIVYGAVLYTILAAVTVGFDRYVLTGVSIVESNLLLGVVAVITLTISAFCGAFMEYSRKRLKMINGDPGSE